MCLFLMIFIFFYYYMRFLSGIDAKKEYSSSGYLEAISLNEFNMRVNQHGQTPFSRVDLLYFYFHDIMTFTREEMEYITDCYQTATRKLEQMFPNFLKKYDIGFIKVWGSLDWFMPYTLNNCIVLPQKLISSSNVLTMINTIVHELVHIHQRNNPEFYNGLYKSMYGFEQISGIIYVVGKYESCLVTNPDAMERNWAIQLYDGLYLPAMVYVNNRHSDVLFRLNKSEQDDNSYTTDETPVLAHSRTDYLNLLMGCTSQISHPHEIMACNITHGLSIV